jgi:hypothetical protein
MQAMSIDLLQKEIGPKTGQTLYNFCRGIDNRPIKMDTERKSVSAEINYGIRFTQVNTYVWRFHLGNVCSLINSSVYNLSVTNFSHRKFWLIVWIYNVVIWFSHHYCIHHCQSYRYFSPSLYKLMLMDSLVTQHRSCQLLCWI